MEQLNKIAYFFRNNWWIIAYIILLVLSFSYFIFLQSTPTLADPDSFYHAKSAMLIPEHGFSTEFPWLQTTILKDSYIDQHFLYHVFLIPFTKIIDPILGIKLANIIFYWLLRQFKIKFAFWFTTLLLITTPFIFRINLIKAPVFSIIILLLGLYFLFKYKYLALFILSFFYVWAYGGFILIILFSGIYAFAAIFKDLFFRAKKRSLGSIMSHSHELRLFFTSLGGVLAGLLINPYFPQNIIFYWHQLVKIGIINQQSIIPVGNEWYPYNFFNLTSGTALMTIVLVIALVLFVYKFKRLNKKTIALFLIYFLFFIFTLKSRRYVEYYIPFAIIFSSFVINEFFARISWQGIWKQFEIYLKKYWIVFGFLCLYFIVIIPMLIVKDVRQTHNDFKNGISIDRFKNVSLWLSENSQPGEIVFHSSWDEFPILFYYNSSNYYIAGLDPTFTYEYNEEAYHKMVEITTGVQKENIYSDIKDIFGASYIFIESNHTAMENNIKKYNKFLRVYKDDEASIYKVL